MARAPKNCICLPTTIGDTQQAIAPSSPHARRMISSLSNCSELVSIATCVAKRRKPSGSRGEYQIVRFGSGAGPEVVERLQEPEARFRHERSAVVAHAGNGLGDPGGIAGEEIVVLRRAQEADDAQLDDEVVDDFLRLLLGERAGGQIPFEVDVEERRGAPERHRGAVLFLDAGEVAEVQPLHGFSRVAPPGREMSKP